MLEVCESNFSMRPLVCLSGKGPVLVPVADATPKNLELLLNTLQGHVGIESLHGHCPNVLTICVL
jgi:hypothetical protein